MNEITLTASFIGGLLSFFSPCILPLLPVYISLFSGLSLAEINKKGSKIRVLLYTLIFIAGFSTVYLALGAGSSFIGSFFIDFQAQLRVIGGTILVLFGLLLMGIIKSGFFLRNIGWNIKIGKIWSPLGAFFVGIGFAAGWSPCIGPILGTILIYSSLSGNVFEGIKMLGMYSMGIAIPFLISSLLIDTVIHYIRKFMKIFKLINYFVGSCLIVLGLIMIFGIQISIRV